MQVPLLDLKGQYAPLRAEIETAIRQVCDEQRFVLGPTSRRARGASRRVLADEAWARLVVGNRCAAARADGARHRPRRRGHHDAVHVLRDGRCRRAPRCAAVLLRHRPRHVQPRSGCRPRGDRGALRAARRPARQSRDRRSDQGAAARAPVRPDGRSRRVHATSRASIGSPSSKMPRRRSVPRSRTAGAPAASATSAACRFSRRRISALSAMPACASRNDSGAARAHAHPARARRRAEVLPLADRRQLPARRAAGRGARDQAASISTPGRARGRPTRITTTSCFARPISATRCRCRRACQASGTSSIST